MRELYLVNENNKVFTFNHKTHSLITALSGLGFGFDFTYADYKNRYVESSKKAKLESIAFDLIFLEGYKGFTSWQKFINESESLRLYYKCDGIKYCYVSLKSSSKEELVANTLKTHVELDKLSLWLIDVNHEMTVVNYSGGKAYSYSYPFTYSASFTGVKEVYNNSSKPAYMKFTIQGNVYNPRIQIRTNNKVIQSLRLYVENNSNPTIIISSIRSDRYMKMVVNGEEQDIYDRQDFSQDNFLYLPPGKSEIFFDPGVREKVKLSIYYLEEYDAH